jgi:hypothetical protein
MEIGISGMRELAKAIFSCGPDHHSSITES